MRGTGLPGQGSRCVLVAGGMTTKRARQKSRTTSSSGLLVLDGTESSRDRPPATVGRQNTIREQDGVRNGMKQGVERRERGPARGPSRVNGRRLRTAGGRPPPADACGGV
jgi:hypothetical protein